MEYFFSGFENAINIHPLFVHFPIALLFISGLFFTLTFLLGNDDCYVAARYNLYAGSLFSVITVVTGIIAGNSILHNHEIHEVMEIHETIMIAVTILSVGLSLFLYKKTEVVKGNKQFLGVLFLNLLLLAIGADFGGKMVFTYGAGTKLFEKVYMKNKTGHGHSSSPSFPVKKNHKEHRARQ